MVVTKQSKSQKVLEGRQTLRGWHLQRSLLFFTNDRKVRNSGLHQEQHYILNAMVLSLTELLLALGLSVVPIKVMGILSLPEEIAVFGLSEQHT